MTFAPSLAAFVKNRACHQQLLQNPLRLPTFIRRESLPRSSSHFITHRTTQQLPVDLDARLNERNSLSPPRRPYHPRPNESSPQQPDDLFRRIAQQRKFFPPNHIVGSTPTTGVLNPPDLIRFLCTGAEMLPHIIMNSASFCGREINLSRHLRPNLVERELDAVTDFGGVAVRAA